MKNMLTNPKVREIVSHITLKKVKEGFGMERCGLMCDFYYNGKRLGEFMNDGNGGCPDIDFISKEAEQLMEVFLEKNNFAELMFTIGGWNFYDSKDEIDLDTQIEQLIDLAYNMNQEKKAMKKIEKLCEKAFVFGTPLRYTYIQQPRPLIEYVAVVGGREKLQMAYNNFKKRMAEKQVEGTLLNTNFATLGLIP